MTKLFAQPYDITANGFYFENLEEYTAKAAANRNNYGQPVEEYELQFIDGESIDAALFEALRVSQVNFPAFLAACEEWDTEQKTKIIIAVGECGYSFTLGTDDADSFDIDIYPYSSLRELAEHFVEEGLFGVIPKEIEYFIDYDALGRNLGFDYTEATIAGQCLVYRAC